MKFAFVIFKYFPYGGVQRDMLRFARACARRGHQVTLYAGEWEGELPEAGIEALLLPPSGWLNHQRRRDFIRQVTARLRQDPPDLVLGFNRMPGLDAWFAADPCYEERGRNQRNWFYRLSGRYRFFVRCEREVARADGHCRILLLSPREKAVYQKWYGTPDNHFIQLPPCIAWQAFDGIDAAEARRALRAEFGFADDELVMLLVGSAFKRKGLDRAIAGLAALPAALRDKTRLLAVGQDDPKDMLILARQLGVAGRVVTTRGRNDVPRLMKGADVLVHPARVELAGNVLIEALAAGLPVLASEECGYAMHIVRAGAGFVTTAPFQQADFNRRLQELLAAPARETWAQAGLAYAGKIRRDAPEDFEADLLESLAREKNTPSPLMGKNWGEGVVEWASYPQPWLAEGLARTLPPGDAFEAAMALQGEVFRDMPGRKTMRVWLGGRAYFIKQHFGVGWAEILKNLLSGKMPILGAETEWHAIRRLHELGIPTMTAVGFGRRGLNPATRRSFLLTEDLGDIVSLEDYCRDWANNPPPPRLKRRLIAAVALIARTLHDNGLNHRDFYLGHFCLDRQKLAADEIRIYLLDLHRMGMRPEIAQSARMKDMAALYFSSMDFNLSTRDYLRFLRLYRNRPLHEIFPREATFWRKVGQRADMLYLKYQERFAGLPKVKR